VHQARALEEGFFLACIAPTFHVHPIATDTAALPREERDRRAAWCDQDVTDWLEQRAFNNDLFALYALRFITQQDQYGYSGAWDPAHIGMFKPPMRWLQVYNDTVHPRSPLARAIIKRRTEEDHALVWERELRDRLTKPQWQPRDPAYHAHIDPEKVIARLR
jgi:hypothetical protein